MADPGRVARGARLLAWLEREGCEHCVRLGETPGAGGVGVFATRDVERGEVLISCPTRTVISAAETRLDLDEGMAAFASAMDDIRVARGGSPEGDPLDDSTRMQLVLLRERHIAETCSSEPTFSPLGEGKEKGEAPPRRSGYWSPYARALPGDELVASLPSSWSDAEIEERLRGTSLFAEVVAERAETSSLAAALARHPDAATRFPGRAFDAPRLRWARAAFWSRAIALPLAGWGRGPQAGTGKRSATKHPKRSSGDDGALTPLLDMCNHARDAGTEVTTRGATWRLVATRAFARDEEIRIDYGGKGNGELLKRHGFVIPNNPFDTCSFQFPAAKEECTAGGNLAFTLHRGVREWREFPPGLLEAAARRVRLERRPIDASRDASDDDASFATDAKETEDVKADLVALVRRENETRDALSFLAESARRLADAAAPTGAGREPEAKKKRFHPDASGFATSSAFLAERACAMYRESQRSLLRDLEDLALETIKASRDGDASSR